MVLGSSDLNVPTSARSPHTAENVDEVRGRLLQRIAEDDSLPALGTAISRVIELASSNDEAVHDLASFVLADVALTQKILRISNTVCYRTMGGAKVTTISKAIFLLGFDTVKTSALAMLLVEGLSRSHAIGVRSELSMALCASVIGRELSRHSPYKDSEEAAVASLFKNIGKVLVAAHDPKSYRAINSLIEGRTHNPVQAATQVIGSSFEVLSELVLRDWQIPESIVYATNNPASGVLKPARSRQEWLQQVAAFSTAAATLIMRSPDPTQDSACRALLTRFGDALDIDQERLTELFANVAEETEALASSIAPLHHISELEETEHEPTEGPTLGGLPQELLMLSEDSKLIGERHASGKPVNARDQLMAGVQDVTEMMASGRCKTNDLIMLVLETIYRCMGFRFATVCFKDARSEVFRARISLGENTGPIQSGFVFPVKSARDLFHLSMENNADLMISDASDPKIVDLLPAWHKRLLPDARSFIVLPLVVQKKALGLFYADRATTAMEGVPPDETALIKMLKSQVLLALSSR